MKLRQRADKLKKQVPAVFLALKRRDTPWTAKIFAFLAVCYALSPVDLIPDFIPVLGYLDDLLILPALCGLAVHFIPEDIFGECLEQSENMWQGGKPKKWYYALPIVIFWGIIIFIIVKNIFF